MDKDIRWKQRHQNLEKAFKLFVESVDIQEPNETEKAGLIQFFEVCFELSWKTLKDYLESLGYILNSPREVLKTAIQMGILTDGQAWLDALDDRNLTTHIYDEHTIDKILNNIRTDYYPAISSLMDYFKNKLNE